MTNKFIQMLIVLIALYSCDKQKNSEDNYCQVEKSMKIKCELYSDTDVENDLLKIETDSSLIVIMFNKSNKKINSYHYHQCINGDCNPPIVEMIFDSIITNESSVVSKDYVNSFSKKIQRIDSIIELNSFPRSKSVTSH